MKKLWGVIVIFFASVTVMVMWVMWMLNTPPLTKSISDQQIVRDMAEDFFLLNSTEAITTGKLYYEDRNGNRWVTCDKSDEWKPWNDHNFHEPKGTEELFDTRTRRQRGGV